MVKWLINEYPLVNVYITMEHHHATAKSTRNGAIFNSYAQQHDGQLRSHEDDGGRRVFRDDGHGYLAPTWGGREGVGPRGNTYWD